jgi:NhaP-type Na+/H+ or K+/H+ antiporter
VLVTSFIAVIDDSSLPGSVLVGLVVGLLSALLFKHSEHLRLFPHYELSCMLLFAYTSYLLSELAGMSGVVSLFLTGVIMKHYNW